MTRSRAPGHASCYGCMLQDRSREYAGSRWPFGVSRRTVTVLTQRPDRCCELPHRAARGVSAVRAWQSGTTDRPIARASPLPNRHRARFAASQEGEDGIPTAQRTRHGGVRLGLQAYQPGEAGRARRGGEVRRPAALSIATRPSVSYLTRLSRLRCRVWLMEKASPQVKHSPSRTEVACCPPKTASHLIGTRRSGGPCGSSRAVARATRPPTS